MDGRPRINADLCHRRTIGGSSAFVDGKHDETETRVARELRARSRGTLRGPREEEGRKLVKSLTHPLPFPRTPIWPGTSSTAVTGYRVTG